MNDIIYFPISLSLTHFSLPLSPVSENHSPAKHSFHVSLTSFISFSVADRRNIAMISKYLKLSMRYHAHCSFLS